MSILCKNDKKKIIELICEKQTRMIIEDSTSYISEEYMELETLKISVKDLKTKDKEEVDL